MPQTRSQTKSWAKAVPPLPPLRTVFNLSALPKELQDRIWTYAAAAWNEKHLTNTYCQIWSVKNKRIFLLSIDVDQQYINPDNLQGAEVFALAYILKFPCLLFVFTASRAIMYDSMLNFWEDEPLLSGENVHLILRNAKSQPEQLAYPFVYGRRIQDLRHPGLEKRVEDEKQRLVEMKAELGRVKCGKVVDPKRRSEEYVPLPLFGVHKRHLYPAMADDVVWREHDVGKRVPDDAVHVLLANGTEYWRVQDNDLTWRRV